MCVFVSRPMKIVTFLRKNGDPPKRVVDFPRERDTFRNKIMDIVEDVDEKSYNNNGKPWNSSRILRVNPNFFIFHWCSSFFRFFPFHHFFIFLFFSFFHVFQFSFFFNFFHFLSFSFIVCLFLSFSLFFIFCHVLSFPFIFFHFLSFSFIFFFFVGCSKSERHIKMSDAPVYDKCFFSACP